MVNALVPIFVFSFFPEEKGEGGVISIDRNSADVKKDTNHHTIGKSGRKRGAPPSTSIFDVNEGLFCLLVEETRGKLLQFGTPYLSKGSNAQILP